MTLSWANTQQLPAIAFLYCMREILSSKAEHVLVSSICRLHDRFFYSRRALFRSLVSIIYHLNYHIFIFENMGVTATSHTLFMTLHIEPSPWRCLIIVIFSRRHAIFNDEIKISLTSVYQPLVRKGFKSQMVQWSAAACSFIAMVNMRLVALVIVLWQQVDSQLQTSSCNKGIWKVEFNQFRWNMSLPFLPGNSFDRNVSTI